MLCKRYINRRNIFVIKNILCDSAVNVIFTTISNIRIRFILLSFHWVGHFGTNALKIMRTVVKKNASSFVEGANQTANTVKYAHLGERS